MLPGGVEPTPILGIQPGAGRRLKPSWERACHAAPRTSIAQRPLWLAGRGLSSVLSKVCAVCSRPGRFLTCRTSSSARQRRPRAGRRALLVRSPSQMSLPLPEICSASVIKRRSQLSSEVTWDRSYSRQIHLPLCARGVATTASQARDPTKMSR